MAHPASCTNPDCLLSYREHLLGIAISATAIPSRRPRAATATEMETGWNKDHAAYRRLRRQGLQPKVLDGCAELENRAVDQFEIETGHIFTTAKERTEALEGMQRAREMAVDA